MLWQVRALLPDRPGAMASLASRCGERGANILALDLHPTAGGEVVDELVVHTPPWWSLPDVEALCRSAGVADADVSPCSPHALEDQPVRWLRAARTVVEHPELLEDLLCRLLDAAQARTTTAADLVLDDGELPRVALSRPHPFTATEQARATELRLVAAEAGNSAGMPSQHASPTPAELADGPLPVVPGPGAVGELRPGTVVETRALLDMHERCSADTLSRRYHAPTTRLSPRRARALLVPDSGFSLLLSGPEPGSVVGHGMVALGPDMVEAALLVEDRWQRQGLGSRLLRALAEHAAAHGATELTLLSRPDDRAVLATVHRAGFRARVSTVHGACHVRLSLRELAHAARGPGGAARGRAVLPGLRWGPCPESTTSPTTWSPSGASGTSAR